MTELAAPQISSLMEALPGIAAVLRSPVASAIVDLVRAGAGLGEFRYSDATELLQFGVRRNLLEEREVEALLLEVEAKVGKPAPPVKAPKLPPKPAVPVAPLTISKPAVYTKAVPPPPPVKVVAKPVAKPTPVKVIPVAKTPPAKLGKAAAVAVVSKKAAAPPAKTKAAAKKAPVSKPANKPVVKKVVPKKAPAKPTKGKAAPKKRR